MSDLEKRLYFEVTASEYLVARRKGRKKWWIYACWLRNRRIMLRAIEDALFTCISE